MVTDDRAEAVSAAGRGEPVVLIVSPGYPPVAVPTGLPPRDFAVLVGDTSDPRTWAAAEAMDAELHPQAN